MRVQMLYYGLPCRLLCMLLAFAIAAGPSAAVLAQERQEPEIEFNTRPPRSSTIEEPNFQQPAIRRLPSDTTLVAPPDVGKMDVQYVTPQSVAYVAARPRQFLTSPSTVMLPVEVATAAGVEHLGIDPVDVDEVIAFVEPPTVMGLSYGIVVKFAKPFSLDALDEQIRAHTEAAELNGQNYLASADPRLPSFFMPDDQTLLVMPEMTLRRVLEPLSPPESPLIDHVREMPAGSDLFASIDVASLRPLIKPWLNVAVMKQGDKFPTEAKPFLEVPDLVSAVDLTFNLTNPAPTTCVLQANDDPSAAKLGELYNLAKELQRQQMAKDLAKFQESDDPIQRAFGNYLERMSQLSDSFHQPQLQGTQFVLFQDTKENHSVQRQLITVAVIGVLVALLLPAVQAAREAARRAQSNNNLKMQLLGMLNYADVKKSLPPHAIYSAGGKPLLSWRVAILPYLDAQDLYEQFHLDEPWDSEHNRALIARMPEVFNNPNLAIEPGKTNYLAIVGKECVFDGTAEGMRLAKITDGLSNTVVLVEADADRAVEWTKPADLEFDPKNPAAGFGKLRPGGCNVGWADGHVSFLPNDSDPQRVKACLTRNGGEQIDAQ